MELLIYRGSKSCTSRIQSYYLINLNKTKRLIEQLRVFQGQVEMKKKNQHWPGIYQFRELLVKLLSHSSHILIFHTIIEIHLFQAQLSFNIVLITEVFLNREKRINFLL